jgi:hypothetical protein
MIDDIEIAWHREQIAKNRTILEELEAGNTDGTDVFPETRSSTSKRRSLYRTDRRRQRKDEGLTNASGHSPSIRPGSCQ